MCFVLLGEGGGGGGEGGQIHPSEFLSKHLAKNLAVMPIRRSSYSSRHLYMPCTLHEGHFNVKRLILINKRERRKTHKISDGGKTPDVHAQNHVSDSGLNNGLQGSTSVNYTGSFLQQLIHPDSFTGVYEN